VATVIPLEDLRRSPRAALFEGGDLIPVSSFITEFDRGDGPDLHLHPYAEVFIVQSGTARFTVGEEQIEVPHGNVVIVPAETAHGFKSVSDDKLRVLSVHPSPTVIQTDL
jgi:mannose-6-phosphate isomerase-like protein (cupin superfamily)